MRYYSTLPVSLSSLQGSPKLLYRAYKAVCYYRVINVRYGVIRAHCTGPMLCEDS